MLSEIEKKVFEKMDFPNRYLRIRRKYRSEERDTPLFKKDQILQLFKELKENCTYATGGSYRIKRAFNNYRFECNFIISKNSVNIYYDTFKNEKFIESVVSSIGSVLRHLPYDATLLVKSFGLNSLSDLKMYIRDHIKLFDEFVTEYIKEIKDAAS